MNKFFIAVLAAVSIFSNSFAYAAAAKKTTAKVRPDVAGSQIAPVILTYQQLFNFLQNLGYANPAEVKNMASFIESKGLKATDKFYWPQIKDNTLSFGGMTFTKSDANAFKAQSGTVFNPPQKSESPDQLFTRIQNEVAKEIKISTNVKASRTAASDGSDNGFCNGIGKSTCELARDFAIGTGLFLAYTPLIAMIAVGGVETEIMCNNVKEKLTVAQRQQFFEYLSFDGKHAAESYFVICGDNKKGESVFLSYLTGRDIDQKLLYTRFNKYQKCFQISKDSASNKKTQSEILAEENRESEYSQRFFAEKAFGGVKTACNQETAGKLQETIRGLLSSNKIQAQDLFSLMMRNNLGSDPRAFIPANDPLLKPITVEQFNAKEKEQQAAWEEWHKQHPDWKPPQ